MGHATSRYAIFTPLWWLTLPFLVGNSLYAVAPSWWAVLAARFLVGLSAAVSTIGRKRRTADSIWLYIQPSRLEHVHGTTLSLVMH